MIRVTRLDGSHIYINAELIQSVQSTPDTHIVLLNGYSYVVTERDADIGPRLEEALQRFETREYFLPTMHASGPETVRILRNMVARHYQRPHRFVCVTDRPDEVDSDIETLKDFGDFSDLRNSAGQPVLIYDPATTRVVGNQVQRDAFPGNVIPAGMIDPAAPSCCSEPRVSCVTAAPSAPTNDRSSFRRVRTP